MFFTLDCSCVMKTCSKWPSPVLIWAGLALSQSETIGSAFFLKYNMFVKCICISGFISLQCPARYKFTRNRKTNVESLVIHGSKSFKLKYYLITL